MWSLILKILKVLIVLINLYKILSLIEFQLDNLKERYHRTDKLFIIEQLSQYLTRTIRIIKLTV